MASKEAEAVIGSSIRAAIIQEELGDELVFPWADFLQGWWESWWAKITFPLTPVRRVRLR